MYIIILYIKNNKNRQILNNSEAEEEGEKLSEMNDYMEYRISLSEVIVIQKKI